MDILTQYYARKIERESELHLQNPIATIQECTPQLVFPGTEKVLGLGQCRRRAAPLRTAPCLGMFQIFLSSLLFFFRTLYLI